jgi:two-component system, OmpR family, sensor histidine kinase TctE
MRPTSLRAQLLVGILVPVMLLMGFHAASLYRQALDSVDTAYDRTLLASAKAIGELLEVVDDGGRLRVRGSVAYAALEAFEADNRSRMFYRVTGFDGEMVSGFGDLPGPQPDSGQRNVYAALVQFYDDGYRGEPVRMAVLLQPVAGAAGQGMATIQVAETLEIRRTLARHILFDTVWRQALVLAVIALVVVVVVQIATRPVRALSAQLQQRRDDDLSPMQIGDAPRELRPVLEATNSVMRRLAHLLEHQKRFVRDASHQLRTPLAVLKTQVQSAQRGDVAPAQALAEIGTTVEGATVLANQMLALAKVEQLRQQGDVGVIDWAGVVQSVALDLAPLIAQARLDFDIELQPSPVRAHEWSLRELTRNLLHNAIKQSPPLAPLQVRLQHDEHAAALTIADSGPGLSSELRRRLFQPFAAGDAPGSVGLGLTICREIVTALKGQIELVNREQAGRATGLDAIVRLPLAGAAP